MSIPVQSCPAVSVIVPMYNAERYIQETLESLASQSMSDFEVLVVNDGSTDGCVTIAKQFALRDSRFRILDGHATGSAGAARNAALAVAEGEYLAFLDADDMFAPSMLEKLYRKAHADAADVVLTGFCSIDDATGARKSQRWAFRRDLLPDCTPFAPTDVQDHIFFATNPANWNKLFRRAFVEEAGLKFQALRRANDAYFTYIALARAKRISYVAEELVIYRVGNAGSLQGSIHETPLEFVQALAGISDSLHECGLYETFERAFLNLVASMSLGALPRAKTIDSFSATYEAVRERIFPRYGLTHESGEVFLSAHLRDRAMEVVSKPLASWLFDRTPSAGGPPLPADTPQAAFEPPVMVSDRPHAVEGPGITQGTPDVSVIVPVYNAATWLHECLLSVLGQSGVALEVICVNDGSTDESARILHEYATSDPRVVVIDRPNGGLSAARNTGLERARGRYTCMLDSDDYWRSDDLATLVARADEHELDVLLFDAETFFDAGVSEANYRAYATYYSRSRSYADVVTGSQMMADLNAANEYRPSACLYLTRTALFDEIGLRFIPGIMHEDNPFTFALLLNAARTAHVTQPLYARRVRPGSIMTAGAAERSMQGYFAAYLDMTRQLARQPVPGELAPVIGDVIHRMFAATRRLFLEAPADSEVRMNQAVTSPEAYSILQILQHERKQTLKIQRLSKG